MALFLGGVVNVSVSGVNHQALLFKQVNLGLVEFGQLGFHGVQWAGLTVQRGGSYCEKGDGAYCEKG